MVSPTQTDQSVRPNVFLDFQKWIEDKLEPGIEGALFMSPKVLKEHLEQTPRIKNVLHALSGANQPLLVDQDAVKQNGTIFAILAKCGGLEYLKMFCEEEDLCDRKLPFHAQPKKFPSAELWSRFDEVQWQFCAHKLTGCEKINISRKRILPYLHVDRETKGGTAKVRRVTVHKDFDDIARKYGISGNDHKSYALKTFKKSTLGAKLYEAELDAFHHFRRCHAQEANNHIVIFYESYIQNDTCNFLMEYADHGTLENYFQCSSQPGSGHDLVQFWMAMTGLIYAVMTIHGLQPDPELKKTLQCTCVPWHQDITPHNILVFSDPGRPGRSIFKLADFGLAHFLPEQTDQSSLDMSKLTAKDSGGTRGYGAPECYRDLVFHVTDRGVGQTADIWSLGGVYSEAVIWTVGGYETLKAYRTARRIATENIPDHNDPGCFHDRLRVLPCVDAFHARAIEEARKTDAITKPLIKRLIARMLYERGGRPTAEQALYEVRLIIAEAEKSLGLPYPTVLEHEPLQTALSTLPHQPNQAFYTELSNSDSNPDASLSSNLQLKFPAGPSTNPVCEPETGPLMHATNTKPDMQDTAEMSHPVPRPLNIDTNSSPCRHDMSDELETEASHNKSTSLHFLSLSMVQKKMNRDRSALLRRMGSKKHNRLVAEIDYDGSIEHLGGRDHVFFIDDSYEMGKHFTHLKELFTALAWIVSEYDKDGMELRFLRCRKWYRSKDSKELADYLKNVTFRGTSDVNANLGDILQIYRTRLDCWNARKTSSQNRLSRFLAGKWKGEAYPDTPKPLSVYILTDGIWQPASDALDSIAPMVNKLHSLGLPSRQVALQFIRFGDNRLATEKLKTLDNLRGLGFVMDIVDHEPSTGNLLKMIIGAVNRDADDDDTDNGGIRTEPQPFTHGE